MGFFVCGMIGRFGYD